MELCRCLLIEDDLITSKALREFLDASDEVRFDVVVADRLQAGLGILRGENHIDVIVLDLGLPDSQHLHAITEIRAISQTVGILVLSGHVPLSDIKKAIDLGADGVRQKPPETPMQFARQIIEAKSRRAAFVKLAAAKDREYQEMLVKVTPITPLPSPTWTTRRKALWTAIGTGTLALLAKLIDLVVQWWEKKGK